MAASHELDLWFPNLEAFYEDRPERRWSGESDYGAWWIGDDGRGWPRYRVSYVEATGEVYVVAAGDYGPVLVLGVIPPDPGRKYYETLDRLLTGWAGGPAKPISWVRERLRQGVR